jgi:hypothetical protein
MMATPPLLIINQPTMKTTAFWLLQSPQVAGWLWLISQAGAENFLGLLLGALKN